jgi:hypothetical protein
MTTPFKYVKVSRTFITDDLTDRVRRGESVVLLGHPNGGKGYVCREIAKNLNKEFSAHVVTVDFAYGNTIANEKLFTDHISQAVLRAGGQELPEGQGLLDALDTLHLPQPLLIASNVDSVAHHVARRFLQEVRTRVEQGRLVVILTGEYNLQELVHGENSEFTAAGQYVMQGFEADEFGAFFAGQNEMRGIVWDDPEIAALWLCQLTGGNLDVTRAIWETCIERRFHLGLVPHLPWRRDWVQQQLANQDFLSLFRRRILQHAVRLVPTEPISWINLEKLIKNAAATQTTGAPGALTLSGIAVRRRECLEFSSELMADAVREHFNHRRLGDLYASTRRWPEAFECYKQTCPEERLRPVTALDREPTERLISVLGSDLRAMAAQSAEKVRELFVNACRYAFGFPEVVFWRRMVHWELQSGGEAPSHEAIAAGREILGEAGQRAGDEIMISPPWEGGVLGMKLAGIWKDQPGAVLVGDFQQRQVLSHERQRLAKELIREFGQAYDHAIDLQRDRQLLSYRSAFESITREIVEKLGSQILDVYGVIQSAATGIRTLSYRRVFFALVDPAEQEIRGALVSQEDEGFTPSMSRWRLSESAANVQPFVVKTKQPLLIEDARTHPLACQEIAEKAGTRGCCIVPLCTGAQRVLGTLHLERWDRSPFSIDEAREFVEFGQTLAALIEQGERIHLLQFALDHQPEPLLVVDACKRIRYGNEPASRLVRTTIPGRWRSAIGLPNPAELSALGPQLAAALEGRRIFQHVIGIGDDKSFRGSLLAEPIKSRTGEILGAFIHIQDLNYLFQVLRALERAASAKDVPSCAERLLDAMEILGHKWGHLWLFDNVTGELVAQSQFNSPDPSRFQGKRLPSKAQEPQSNRWWCIDRKAPLIFSYSGRDVDSYTPSGLRRHEQSRPRVFSRTLGDHWIDVPLLAGDRCVGKMVLQCEPDLRPEHLEALRVLAQTLSVILEGFITREDFIRIEEAERSLAKLSHMVGTRYAFLWPAYSAYKRLEHTCPPLAELNKAFGKDLLDLEQILTHAKEMLRGFVPEPKEFDLIDLLKKCIAQLPAKIVAASELTVLGDERLLKDAVQEILANGMKAMELAEEPGITVKVESTDADNRVSVSISNSGRGVPLEYKERIFDPFFSYHPQGRLGTGLGLHLVSRIVRAHGGSISEVGTEGQGACFVIDLPRRWRAPEPVEMEQTGV